MSRWAALRFTFHSNRLLVGRVVDLAAVIAMLPLAMLWRTLAVTADSRVVERSVIDRNCPFFQAMGNAHRGRAGTDAALAIVGLKRKVIEPAVATSRSLGSN